MTFPLVDLARSLPAMVDLGQVDEDTAVDALAEQASWRAGHLRETALQVHAGVAGSDTIRSMSNR